MGMDMGAIEQAMIQAIENQEDSIMSQVNQMNSTSLTSADQNVQGASPQSNATGAGGAQTSASATSANGTQSSTTTSEDMLSLQFSMQQWNLMVNMTTNIQKEMKDCLSSAIRNLS